MKRFIFFFARNRCLLIMSSFFIANTVFCANPAAVAKAEKQEAAEIRQLDAIEEKLNRESWYVKHLTKEIEDKKKQKI